MIRRAIDERDMAELSRVLDALEVPEVLEHLESLPLKDSAIAYRMLHKDRAMDVFEMLDAPVQAELLEAMQGHPVTEVFAAMDPDDRVALLDELPAQVAAKLLQGLGERERRETNVLLGYSSGVVGHVMSPNFVTTHPGLSVAQTMRRIHRVMDDVESIYTVLITDGARRLVGVVSLRELMGADDEQLVGELASEPYTATANEPVAVAARRTIDTRVMVMPVLDLEERVVGVLTIDDAIRLIDLEEEERSARGAGTEPLRRPYLTTPIRSLVKSRLVWLLVLGIGATLTVQVLSSFEETLESMVVLSLFIPLVVGIGGNTGNQAATTVTRALAVGDIRVADLGRVLLREVRVGGILGLCLGSLALLIASLVFDLQVALIIGVTLVALCTIAAAVGGIMPIIGKLLRVDPAVFSNPFISTFVDAAGLVVYFSVAMSVVQNFGGM
ncbi:magnesium transporter [Glutamicibacter creatinolyticus]|uniref:magnesium transporter n=1 Tax=Glutamicibacter creatinolyticus TaxID=162496 RepID=UPI003216FCCE